MEVAIPTLILIRHGETALNKPGMMRGWSDIPLDKKGLYEARYTANEVVEEWPIAKIYTSDLRRAEQSTEFISKKLDQKPILTPDLRPWNGGELVGKYNDDLGEQLKFYIEHPSQAPQGGETMKTFTNRLINFVSQVMDEAEMGTTPIALVTSIRPIEAIVGWVEGGMNGRIDPDRLEAKNECVGPSGVVVLEKLKKQWKARIWKKAEPVKHEGKS